MDLFSPLPDLDDDTLIAIFSFLPVPSILAMRQTCRRILSISCARIIWHNAYVYEVMHAGFPFPRERLGSMNDSELEYCVRRAVRIGHFWRSPGTSLRKLVDFPASFGTGVTDVRFLPGHGGRRVATVTKGIWSMVTIWEITAPDLSLEDPYVRKVAEWCPKGMIITGFVVNSDAASEGIAAASVNGGGRQCIVILAIVERKDKPSALQPIKTIQSPFRPVTLRNDLIAYSDEASKTVVMNWITGSQALLHNSSYETVDDNFQYNKCLQVVFAYESVLVVRARSIELFTMVPLKPPSDPLIGHPPIARHSFGWIDGVSVSIQAHDQCMASRTIVPFSILLRAESDDPWASDVHRLDLYTLEPNPLYEAADSTTASGDLPGKYDPSWKAGGLESRSPYLFPPKHSHLSSPSMRGFLRCTDILLGPYGTAVWIQPRPARSADLTSMDVHASQTQTPETSRGSEALVGAVFAGSTQCDTRHTDLTPRHMWTQSFGSSIWTSTDYIEELGMIALASSQGMVTVLRLV